MQFLRKSKRPKERRGRGSPASRGGRQRGAGKDSQVRVVRQEGHHGSQRRKCSLISPGGAPTGEANGRPWNERPTDVKKCPWGSEVPPILAQVLAALPVPRATTATPLATDGTLWARSSRIRRINSLQTAAWRRPIRILPCWEAVLHISPKPEERRERLLGYTECAFVTHNTTRSCRTLTVPLCWRSQE